MAMRTMKYIIKHFDQKFSLKQITEENSLMQSMECMRKWNHSSATTPMQTVSDHLCGSHTNRTYIKIQN